MSQILLLIGQITVLANNLLLSETPPGPFQDPYGAIIEGLINVKEYAWKLYANTSQMSIGAG